MQAVSLTHDHYSSVRQAPVRSQQAAAYQGQARPAVLPAERVVEGEVLRDRASSGGDSLDQLLQRSRYVNSAANFPDVTMTRHGAQRAINAYLDTLSSPATSTGTGRSGSVDFYV